MWRNSEVSRSVPLNRGTLRLPSDDDDNDDDDDDDDDDGGDGDGDGGGGGGDGDGDGDGDDDDDDDIHSHGIWKPYNGYNNIDGLIKMDYRDLVFHVIPTIDRPIT